MSGSEISRLIDLNLRIGAARTRWCQSSPPFYQGRKTNMEAQKKSVTIARDIYVKELQELRRDIATLHNHKEVVAYSALSLNIAGTAWLINNINATPYLTGVLLAASSLLHFMMRFQLIQRWHCTQFYQIYRTAIQKLSEKQLNEIDTEIVDASDEPLPNALVRPLRYVFWMKRQAYLPMTFNYPTTLILHEEIQESNKVFFSGKRKISLVEKIPTIASLACAGLILAQFPLIKDRLNIAASWALALAS